MEEEDGPRGNGEFLLVGVGVGPDEVGHGAFVRDLWGGRGAERQLPRSTSCRPERAVPRNRSIILI